MTIVLLILGLYLALGVLFALPFITRGVRTIDPAAEGAPWSFRLLILPGSAALWPVLLAKWARGSRPTGSPGEPGRGRIERTRGVLLGPGALWAAVLLAWFIITALSRAGVGP